MKDKINFSRRKFVAFGLVAALPLGWVVKKTMDKRFAVNQSQSMQPDSSAALPDSHARLGINLSGVSDWSSEQIFVDLFHRSREWISRRKSSGFGAGPPLALDESGWVKKLEANCFATTFLCAGLAGHYPSGDYIVLYDGEGELTFDSGDIVQQTPGRVVLQIDATRGDFSLNLIKTNPSNYLRNIRVIMPGFEAAYQGNPWHPAFLKRWSGIACVRLMDLMATNNASQIMWSERPKVTDASYASKGVPLELLIDLANRLDTDAWFCIPHQADDDYVRQFAQMVKARFNLRRRAWLEYSNEVWNGSFEQNAYAAAQGQRLKLARAPWQAGLKFYAQRSMQIFKIWEEVFGGRKRFVRVLASQAGYSDAAQRILSFQNAAKSADVLAIAPYMGMGVTPKKEDNPGENEVAAWRLDDLFNYLSNHVVDETITWISANKKIANQYGLLLVAYEGGQHLVGVQGAENNEKLTRLFMQANADKRMGELYASYLNAWGAQGGDLMCLYNSVSAWSKWGSWGLLQYSDDSPAISPKFMAALKWAQSRGQRMHLPQFDSI